LKNAPSNSIGACIRIVASYRKQFSALVCLALFLASLGRYWVSYDPRDSVPRDPETFRLAHNLAETGQFANPFVPLDTGPSAVVGPAFPAMLARLISEFGDGSAGIYAIKLTAVIVLSLQLAFFPLFSRALGMGQSTGFIAAAIWVVGKVGITRDHRPLSPPLVMFGWEAFYAAILIAVAVCCCRRYLDLSKDSSCRLAWLIGFLLGALALISPVAGVIFIGWFVWVAWRNRSVVSSKTYLIAFLLPIIIVTPWVVRNYLVFHRLILVRDNFGLELGVSNNDCATFGNAQNLGSGCFAKVHPNANLDEARKVLADGEPVYNQKKLQEAKYWIRSHPKQFFSLSALRLAAFWFPPATQRTYSLVGPGRKLERVTVYVMTLLSLPGLVMLYRRDKRSAAMCATCLSLYPLVYYIVQYDYRYRYPILWVTFLLGAFPITALCSKLWRDLTVSSQGKSGNVRLVGCSST